MKDQFWDIPLTDLFLFSHLLFDFNKKLTKKSENRKKRVA